jgi:hypothetical protein
MAQEIRRQRTDNTTNVEQSEVQGLTIVNSHNIQVTQTELQGLLLIQVALQASIEAAIIVLGTNQNNNIEQLQRLSQSLNVSNIESQSVIIRDSDGIVVTQTEVQVDVVVQAAINLIAKLLVQIG